ncbi:AIPR family protein [Gammaproteobacteria bacterium]|nr:AIPR family protein [Gammaproteobacteria bacterium]
MADIDKNVDELLLYKKELLNEVMIGAEASQLFSETTFLETVTDMLASVGALDNVELQQYRNKNKGMRIDGFAYNPLEGILTGIVVKFSNDLEELTTITKAEIEALGKQTAKFIENIHNEKFISSLALTDPGRQIAASISDTLSYIDPKTKEKNKFDKFRVIIITDCILSDRIKDPKKLAIADINGVESAFEVWALNHIRDQETSGNESIPISIDFNDYCENQGLETLPANTKEKEMSSYICVLPGLVLQKLFADYGQRLLESNVRTFLSFRGKVNNGMRATLLKDPESFFAYNNGLTVTASEIKTIQGPHSLLITHLENMQIVNGGQTTSTIYFSPLEKGSQDGLDFRDIDLSKVFVQMKLTVIEDKDKSDLIKSNIAQFANTQNPIQAADLVANHPFHIKLEELSRKHSVPAGDMGMATKWFYERSRGQYETELRSRLGKNRKDKFILQYPKAQKFAKTDMAKYENTYRMKPFEVKQGAQKNLELLGKEIVREWDKNPLRFEFIFYKDLVAKAILFKESDKAILQSEWYKMLPGFKADIVTYTLALLRHLLLATDRDLNLERIYNNQKLSSSLIDEILALGYVVRKNLLNDDFRQGDANPSSFGKKRKAWDQYKTIEYTFKHITKDDCLNQDEIRAMKGKARELNQLSGEVNFLTAAYQVSDIQWEEFYAWAKINLKLSPKELKILDRFSNLSKLTNPPLDSEYKTVVTIRNKAIQSNQFIE